jgi:hypothetical protein
VPLDLSPSHELPQAMKKMYVEALKVDTFPQATEVLISTDISITTTMLLQFSHKNSKSLEI